MSLVCCRYAKVEKIPGGEIEDCKVLNGVMFNKDVTHSKMRRRIENPRIMLLDCPLEYKKGESQTNVEITDEADWNTMLRMEEEYIENQCAEIIAFKPDIVITEKGVSDLAQHYLTKANITAFRRLRKTDNNRVARACGATIVSRTDELQESDIGTGCGLFEVRKLGDEYFTFLEVRSVHVTKRRDLCRLSTLDRRKERSTCRFSRLRGTALRVWLALTLTVPWLR